VVRSIAYCRIGFQPVSYAGEGTSHGGRGARMGDLISHALPPSPNNPCHLCNLWLHLLPPSSRKSRSYFGCAALLSGESNTPTTYG
jgi:hypothetical protein